MEQLIAFLNSIHVLSPGCNEYLLHHIKEMNPKRHDFLLKPGQVSKIIYFVEKGLFRAYDIDDGAEISTWFMKAGNLMVSISSFYKQVESTEYIQALQDSKVYYITYDELNYLYGNFLEFNYVGRVLQQEYYVLWDQILKNIRKKGSRERFIWLRENHPDLFQLVPQKYLASFLGMSEVQLSYMKRAT